MWNIFELRVHKHVIDLFSSSDAVKQITSITNEQCVNITIVDNSESHNSIFLSKNTIILMIFPYEPSCRNNLNYS